MNTKWPFSTAVEAGENTKSNGDTTSIKAEKCTNFQNEN